ncbi:hypothetical protein KY348_01390 [Candidatus Woesearchaeota archaeon]|nr:hypothetical protein [Candidatus Woesearchaeota archaeon]
MPKISVSTLSFYYWVENPREDWINSQLQVLDWIKDVVDNVELHMINKDILKLTDEHILKYKQKLAPFETITLHLPSNFSDVFSQEEFPLVDKKINALVKELNIKHCVFHADHYAKAGFNFTFPVAIENPDTKSANYQNLFELKDLNKPLVIDVNHIEEKEQSLFDKQYRSVKNRIVEIHFSVLKNDYYKKFPYVVTPHYLAYKSGQKLPQNIPKDVIWVVEGVIPNKRMDLLKSEIELIKNY